MKTVKEWLLDLPDNIRFQALENHKGYKGKYGYSGSLYIALQLAFKWSSTPEGREFWDKIAQVAKKTDKVFASDVERYLPKVKVKQPKENKEKPLKEPKLKKLKAVKTRKPRKERKRKGVDEDVVSKGIVYQSLDEALQDIYQKNKRYEI